ncbi:DinB family protein [Neobacillus sp. K501]
MNRKDVILEQFLLCDSKNGWFVSFKSAVAELNAEQATWKNTETENSIREIISHLVFWNERYLNRFKGIPIQKMEGDNDSTFDALNDVEWNKSIERFHAVMKEWYQTIQLADEEKLDQQVSEDSKGSWLETLTSITLHNAYHIGQIVTIRKLQGSWRKEIGVS